jgi:hypothetical protein
MKNVIRILLISVLFVNTMYAQTQKDKERYKVAEGLLSDENFNKAVDIYLEILKEDTLNANIKYKIGLCYLFSPTEVKKSIPYLEYASEHISLKYRENYYKEKHAPIDAMFYLGMAYHLNYDLDKAESTLNKLKIKLKQRDKKLLAKIDYELAACETTRELMKTPIDVKIENVGSVINTEYDEHSPLISLDDKIIIFTSKRKGNTGGRQTYDGQYFEDVYIGHFDGDNFVDVEKISSNINTEGHDACAGLSHDGKQLLLFRSSGDGGLFISNKVEDEWTVPEKLPGHINSIHRETSACFTSDNNTIYFTSDRPGGYGGFDIYKSTRLQNGKWGEVVNLGASINTPYDEESPYVSQTGKHFFFASKGHNTMGGYDIFICSLLDGDKWSTPQNVGYPVNTPADQIFETSTFDSKIFYITSKAYDGYGRDDIFRVTLPEDHIANIVKQSVIVAQKSDDVAKQDVKPTESKAKKAVIKKDKVADENVVVEKSREEVVVADNSVEPKQNPTIHSDDSTVGNVAVADSSMCLLMLLIAGSLFIIFYWIFSRNRE